MPHPVSPARPIVRAPLALDVHDVVPTGNEWLSLPDIRAADGAVTSLNLLSLAHRGLLQARGTAERPLLRPTIAVDDRPVEIGDLAWSLIAFWIPVARTVIDGIEIELTHCAPLGSRAAFVHVAVTNRRDAAIEVRLGAEAAWGGLERITYQPVELGGSRSVGEGLWVVDATSFAHRTDDTRFVWSIVHRDMEAVYGGTAEAPTAVLTGDVETVAPGATVTADLVLSAGLEDMSAPHHGKALSERLDRLGAAAVIADTAARLTAWTRTTGRDDLDLLMNRNAMFTRFFAWGKTIDGEATVGVTSRSPRYYVSAAYWDRDAMIWSFPGLLRFDPAMAREALGHALGPQLRNTGIHSRFIDGVVLEDGFQLDAAAAPILALAAYLRATGDRTFVVAHAAAIDHLAATLTGVRDARTGLFTSWQDAQDEYRRHPFLTCANVLAWKALGDLGRLAATLGRAGEAASFADAAERLRAAILTHLVIEHDGRRMFAAGWDGEGDHLIEDIPPGSLFRLPALGFVDEDDPVFVATADWLRSPAHVHGHHGAPYGLPGSYRLPFTTAWVLADHLRITRFRDEALRILTATTWDGGIITEGLDPATGRMDRDGRAFATAAGYVAAAICDVFCGDEAEGRAGPATA